MLELTPLRLVLSPSQTNKIVHYVFSLVHSLLFYVCPTYITLIYVLSQRIFCSKLKVTQTAHRKGGTVYLVISLAL